jgi:hypothetical protein
MCTIGSCGLEFEFNEKCVLCQECKATNSLSKTVEEQKSLDTIQSEVLAKSLSLVEIDFKNMLIVANYENDVYRGVQTWPFNDFKKVQEVLSIICKGVSFES